MDKDTVKATEFWGDFVIAVSLGASGTCTVSGMHPVFSGCVSACVCVCRVGGFQQQYALEEGRHGG